MPDRRSSNWLRLLVGNTSPDPAVNIGLLALRAALAWVFIYYGSSKLFGAFPGGAGSHGIHDTAQFMADTAHLHPGTFFAVVGGLVEFGGGIAMALGLATRLAGLALFGDMVMAIITVTGDDGFTRSAGGFQLDVALAGLALAAAFIGAGRFSVDATVTRQFARADG